MQKFNATRRVVKARASLGMEQPSTRIKPVSPTVYVYSGPGAGTRCALTARESLEQHFKQHVQIRWLGPEALLAGHWKSNCILLVMPGGADLPYCRLLNGKGNQLIKEYVKGGGSYLGLCAGAYYGTARVEFEVGNPVLEVIGDRELGFWPGTARGAAYAGFDYTSEHGAVAAPLTFLASYTVSGSDKHSTHEQPQASTNQQNSEKSVSCRLGLDMLQPGLSTVAEGNDVWQNCVDYCNGGPVFVTSEQQDVSMTDESTTGGDQGEGGGDKNVVTDCETLTRARAGLLYVPPKQLPSSCTVLAHYADAGPQAIAAVRCHVGAGVAVLCSSHPELSTRWLRQPELVYSDTCAVSGHSDSDNDDRPVCGKSDLADDNNDDESLKSHVAKLVTALDASQTQRTAFLHMLLAACCVHFKPCQTSTASAVS